MTCQHPSHLHMTCGRRADDVRTTYVICHLKSPTKSHSRVIRTSSACRPRIVRTSSAGRMHETSVPRLFQVKHQRTALLKIRRFKIGFNINLDGHYCIRLSRTEAVERVRDPLMLEKVSRSERLGCNAGRKGVAGVTARCKMPWTNSLSREHHPCIGQSKVSNVSDNMIYLITHGILHHVLGNPHHVLGNMMFF